MQDVAIGAALRLVGIDVFFAHKYEAMIGLTTVAYNKSAERGRQDFVRGKQHERMAEKRPHVGIEVSNGIAGCSLDIVLAFATTLADEIVQLRAGLKNGG